MIFAVHLSKKARKNLEKCPKNIIFNFYEWRTSVIQIGLEETRKTPGFHDEPLQGKWFGFRSVRLNLKYRIIYKIVKKDEIYIEVIEVTPHEYKKR